MFPNMKKLEKQMKKIQEEMKNKLITGSSGNGLVTVILNGEKNLQEIKINPECMDPSDVEGLQDLILAAFEDASQKADRELASQMPGLPF